MSTEVEVKAWVDDMGSLRSRVAKGYEHIGSYVKEDTYFALSEAAPSAAPGDASKPGSGQAAGGGRIEFRLRVQGQEAYVTGKRKSVVEGVEINDEIEFAVDDAQAFKRFAEYLGAKVFALKRKSGDSYRAGDATVELSHVDRLGDFIEIERIVEDSQGAAVKRAEQEVRSLLHELGVPKDKIEPRYYIDMLAGLDAPGGASTRGTI